MGSVAASATAFTVLKLLGAGYVVYLGVQAIRHRADARAALETEVEGAAPVSGWVSVRTGLVVGATNPKTIVFFVAFLPQFVDAGAPAGPQLALLGVLFGVMAVCSDTCWALLAARFFLPLGIFPIRGRDALPERVRLECASRKHVWCHRVRPGPAAGPGGADGELGHPVRVDLSRRAAWRGPTRARGSPGPAAALARGPRAR